MNSLLCTLAPLTLGGALAAPLYWWICRGKRPLETELPRVPAGLHILWFTPECRKALGQYARPGRLRRLSERCICRRLSNYPFPPNELPPTSDQYKTWPQQAELICAGEFERLYDEQQSLLSRCVPSEAGEHTVVDRPCWRTGVLWTALFLTLLILALTLYSVSRSAGWCSAAFCPACVPTLCPQPIKVSDTKDLSTDLVFEFNKFKPYSDEHVAKMQRDLADFFSDFQNVEIMGIVAHTDPIGNDEDNRDLALKRGEYIRQMLMQVVQLSDVRSRFVTKDIPANVVTAQPASRADFPFWRACFSRYYLQQIAKPLEDLSKDLNPTGRKTCSTSDEDVGADGQYPACRRLMLKDGDRSTVNHYGIRAENFRELTACLAPMRHVLVKFTHTRPFSAANEGTN